MMSAEDRSSHLTRAVTYGAAPAFAATASWRAPSATSASKSMMLWPSPSRSISEPGARG